MLILDFIKKFIAQNGYSPTIREIQNGLAIKSPSTVHDHLRKLVDCQILAYIPSKSRTIELLVENEYLKDEIVHIQFIDKNDYISLPAFMLNESNIDNVVAYKSDKNLYVIDKSLNNYRSMSLYKSGKKHIISSNSDDGEYIGTVISKIEVF